MTSPQGRTGASRSGDGALSKASSSDSNSLVRRAASNAATVAKKLIWRTGRAAWIAGTAFLVLAVPLMIEMDREQQMNELDMQQASLLGASPSTIASAGSMAPAM